ncbi:MAG TPA: pitrilysin family protein [Thermoanaerobaculia bacterium]|nr:pitrilysin family protein [Thermoanaerobaculia bacterium]
MKRLIALMLLALAAAPLSAQEVTATAQDQQVSPPAPAAPREAKLPQPVEKTLANGLRVIVVPKHDIPLVAATLMFKTGAEADPANRPGLAQLTANVLTKGTKTRTAEEIARGVEALGATIEASAGWDQSSIDLSVMASNFTKALVFVGDVARNATFSKEEVDLQRSQTVDSLQVALRQPRTLGSYVMSKLLFAGQPYGHPAEGTPKSLEKIKREDLVAFHKANYRPDNAVFVVAGDIEPDAVFNAAQQQFGSWARGTATKTTMTAATTAKPASPRVVVVDLPDAGQAMVVVGRQGIRRTDPNYFPAIVSNSVLGGGYSARLNQEIRIKRGLSYGSNSSFSARRNAGPFLASTQTKNESAAEVAGITLDEMARMGATDVPDTELTPRKAVLIGGFARSLETSSGIVNQVATLALNDLPLTDINRYISGVQAVNAEAVRGFAGKNFAGSDASVVIVGDAKKFIEPLRKRFPDVEVIPVSQLDLDASGIRERKAKQ